MSIAHMLITAIAYIESRVHFNTRAEKWRTPIDAITRSTMMVIIK